MIRVELDTTIKRPINEVFDRLVNISGYADWLPKSRVFLESKQTSEGAVGAGTNFVDKTRIGTFRGQVTDFKRPTKVNYCMMLRWLDKKVLESRPMYTLEPFNGHTQVHLLAEGKLYGLYKLFEPYVAIEARRERRRTLLALKNSLESTTPATRTANSLTGD